MRAITEILRLAHPLEPGFHIKIHNPPWQDLVIEDIQQRGPRGLPTISVAHYGEQNGDLMRDPEMLFEMEELGREVVLLPYYYRNDYVGFERYSVTRDENRVCINSRLLREQESFARMWNANIRAQGFVDAFRSAGKRGNHDQS